MYLHTWVIRYILLFISLFNSLLSLTADADDSDGDQEERSSYNDLTREVWFHYFITTDDNNDAYG